MSNLHRIQWIDAQIRDGRYPNCSTIARRFEITRRQASRDIEYLRYSLGAPVEYDHERNGYRYSEDGFSIPKEKITRNDADLLARLSESYYRIDSAEGKRIADLFARLYRVTTSDETSSPDPGNYSHTRAGVESCIRTNQDIQITYIDAGNGRTVRRVSPRRIFQQGVHEYVEGWCHLRNQSRQFRLDRIVGLEAVDASAAHGIADDDSSADEIAENGGKEIDAFDALPSYPREPFIAEIRTGTGFQKTMMYRFYDSMELIAWLLRRSPAFEVLRPIWLREKVRTYFEQLETFHHG